VKKIIIITALILLGVCSFTIICSFTINSSGYSANSSSKELELKDWIHIDEETLGSARRRARSGFLSLLPVSEWNQAVALKELVKVQHRRADAENRRAVAEERIAEVLEKLVATLSELSKDRGER